MGYHVERASLPRTRLHHTHLFASDLDATLDFYRRWFGAEVVADESFFGARNVMVSVGDGRLNFYDQAPPDQGRGAVHHLGIQTDDLAALVAEMTAGGVPFRSPIRDSDVGRYIMVEAPDGVLLELFEFPPGRQTPVAARWFDWGQTPIGE